MSSAVLIIDNTYPQAIWHSPDLYMPDRGPQIFCTNDELRPRGKNSKARLMKTTEMET